MNLSTGLDGAGWHCEATQYRRGHCVCRVRPRAVSWAQRLMRCSAQFQSMAVAASSSLHALTLAYAPRGCRGLGALQQLLLPQHTRSVAPAPQTCRAVAASAWRLNGAARRASPCTTHRNRRNRLSSSSRCGHERARTPRTPLTHTRVRLGTVHSHESRARPRAPQGARCRLSVSALQSRRCDSVSRLWHTVRLPRAAPFPPPHSPFSIP